MPDEPLSQTEPADAESPAQGALFDRPPDLVEKTYLRWQELLLERRRIDLEIQHCERFLNQGAPSRERTVGHKLFAQCHCLRCGHDWTPANRKVSRPQACPECRSRRWDREDYPGEAPEEIVERKPGSGRHRRPEEPPAVPGPVPVPTPRPRPAPQPVEVPVEVPAALRKYIIGTDLPAPPRLRDFVPDQRTRFGEDS